MKLFTFVLAAALCTPAFAQISGSANRNAPEIKQSITTGGATISLDYKSVVWGNTPAMAMDKDKGAETRGMINELAKTKPLGTLTSSVDVTCGDLKLAAGEYKVSFTIDDKATWMINFTGKDDKVASMKLPLNDSNEESKQLLLCLYAGDNKTAGVYVSFGKKMGFLSFAPAKAGK